MCYSMTIEVLGSDNVPLKVEVKTEQWIKVENEEVKQEQMEPEPLNLVPSLLQHRITDTNVSTINIIFCSLTMLFITSCYYVANCRS